ncbi:acetyl-CoA carboxylase carboxyltransferase subunit beta [Pseudenhygromyxa sp. WMMC2535]|uniref:acetyl-CoA carboxylase, carboxyltransferase subunit beta n=1 Tax=Pseudenhygromyxa sp. WMMC2535 TaxID=2712867 RepID=UPI0015542C0B|nr:acetyl-CoA carboxylase, carboxyltransferase subunit beta [Pseudenhygromyxa sp. WMMC2535]NVB41829.1 acetyl-CoA carboxylase carboxyltransferase subunit beta [Pseudenhygromyxa sp. WMMC2535]
MAWWRRKKPALEQPNKPGTKTSVPPGLWSKCESCGEITYTEELVQNLRVCPVCAHHHVMPTDERIASLIDEDSWTEHDIDLTSGDPLGFEDSKRYSDRIAAAKHKSGRLDAFVSGTGTIDGVPVSAGFFAFEFMGGSMGSVVGEKCARVFERAVEQNRAALVFSASGGARMQEGILSLMQMAKTSAARARLREAGLPYISVLLHPTTGGVAASFAFLGDLILAEPRALIGFAGPRVIQQTIGQELPEGFQRSEFLIEHGMIDRIVSRLEMREQLAALLRLLGSPGAGDAAPQPRTSPATSGVFRGVGN